MRAFSLAVSLTGSLAAVALASLVAATAPAGAQALYTPGAESGGYRPPPPGRKPERPPEPRRPRPPGGQPGSPGGYGMPPGFGIIVAPPGMYGAPPPRTVYEADEPPPPRAPRPRRTEKPAPEKPAAQKPAAKKPPAKPPARPATAARPPVPPPAAAVPDRVPDEVVFELRPDVSEAEIDAVLRRFALTPIARIDFALLGTSIQHARIPRGSNVTTVLRQLAGDPRVSSAQPNHLFEGQTEAGVAGPKAAEPESADAQPPAPAPAPEPAPEPEFAAAQYAPVKMRLDEAHRTAQGRDVLIAVIDSAVDAGHPELAAALVEAEAPGTPHAHGTAMAGAIAAHVKLVGVAPGARILALDALKYDPAGGARGTTIDILAALDTAAKQGARVVNLSFAGPRDELMARALRALRLRGAVLVAAVGNAGPKAKPLYPAAHPDVIGVTATDAQDALYAQAVPGPQVALAAPGVEVMVPAPGGAYAVLSGTSLASAQLAGIAALLLERDPTLTPQGVRDALVASARDLGKPGRDDQFGAGLVDAAAALESLVPAAAAAETTPQAQPAALR